MVLYGIWYAGVARFPCNSMGKVALKMCAVLFRSRIYVPFPDRRSESTRKRRCQAFRYVSRGPRAVATRVSCSCFALSALKPPWILYQPCRGKSHRQLGSVNLRSIWQRVVYIQQRDNLDGQPESMPLGQCAAARHYNPVTKTEARRCVNTRSLQRLKEGSGIVGCV